MYRFLLAGIAFVLATPACAFAGAQTFSTPGTQQFVVPAYGTLTVKVWGAGGGGGSDGHASDGNGSGGTGGNSSFGSMTARGGAPGTAYGGAGGTASGGTTNVTGGAGTNSTPIDMGPESEPYPLGGNGGVGANGGVGGAGSVAGEPGNPGATPGGGGGGGRGGGGGGGGGYSSRTYANGELTQGSPVSVTVGVGGGICPDGSFYGCGSGGAGRIEITWIDAVTPPPPPPPPPVADPSCSITFDQNPIQPGVSTTIRWSSQLAETFYINSIGYVSAVGSAVVEPSQTTNFDGLVRGPGSVAAGGDTAPSATCLATLTVNAQCIPAYSCSSNGILNSCTGNVTPCPFGQICANGQCIDHCAVAISCVGNAVFNSCTNVTMPCAPHHTCINGFCEPPAEAEFEVFPTTAGFTATGHLQIVPPLVQEDHPTRVYWNATNVQSCIVTGANGDSWTDVFSGAAGRLTSGITERTVYTLHCVGLPGAIPASITETATVNIVPRVREL